MNTDNYKIGVCDTQCRGFAVHMSKEKELTIALFGIEGSGKTVYLSMLVYDIRNNQEEYSIEYNSSVSEQYLNDQIELITVKHEFPKSTSFRESQILIAVSEIEKKKKLWIKNLDLPSEIAYELFVPGADGVAFEDPFIRRNHRYRGHVDFLDNLIEESEGFLFLIDPSQEKSAIQDAMIGNIIRAIARRKGSTGCENLQVPIAFCLTMWDEYEDANSDPKAYASKILRVSLNRFAQRLPMFKLFICSAVGEVKITEEDDVKTMIPGDTVSPKDVFTPISWFFEVSDSTTKKTAKKKESKKKKKKTPSKRKSPKKEIPPKKKKKKKKKKEEKEKLPEEVVKEVEEAKEKAIKEEEVKEEKVEVAEVAPEDKEKDEVSVEAEVKEEKEEVEEEVKEEIVEVEEEVKPEIIEEEPAEIIEVDFETEAKTIMEKLSVDDFIEWTRAKLLEKPDKDVVIVLGQLLVENVKRAIDEGAFESVTRNLDTLDDALIFDYSINESIDITSVYEQTLTIIKEQKVSSHDLEYMVSEMCSQIEKKEKLTILLIDEKLINQKQGLLATLFYTLYRQDPEAFIRNIDKAPQVMSLLVGEEHAAKWLTTTYILINKTNETVGSKILETMLVDADRLSKIPHPGGFSVYFKTLMNTADEKQLSKLLKTIIEQLQKCNRGYEALEYLKPLELLESDTRYRMIRSSFEDISNASPEDIDEFAKMMISIDAWYGSLSSEIKGDPKTRFIVLDLGLHLVRSLKALMEKMVRKASDKEEELGLLYVKARFLLNGIVRMFRSHADKKMAEKLRDGFKSLPKDKKMNRDLWIKTGDNIVEEKKKSG